jgi:hypothetical protein
MQGTQNYQQLSSIASPRSAAQLQQFNPPQQPDQNNQVDAN